MMRIAQHRLAIVLPAYNESHTLAATIRAFHAVENMPTSSSWTTTRTTARPRGRRYIRALPATCCGASLE